MYGNDGSAVVIFSCEKGSQSHGFQLFLKCFKVTLDSVRCLGKFLIRCTGRLFHLGELYKLLNVRKGLFQSFKTSDCIFHGFLGFHSLLCLFRVIPEVRLFHFSVCSLKL